MENKPIVALIYDFDKTLCKKDMQEYGFIESIKRTPDSFWKEAKDLAESKKMDNILAYMYLMIKYSKNLKRELLLSFGSKVEFFAGVEEWFERINEVGESLGVKVEHYIISSGLKEIIEGTNIKQYFKEIYASEFFYNEGEIAIWPKLTVNYTGKTQFLFRINKGVLDVSDDKLNEYIADEQRRIPFANMVYIGDGFTDVPCMQLVKSNGGNSIVVYKEGQENIKNKLIAESRVDFAVLADYSKNCDLEKIIKNIIQTANFKSEYTKI